MNAFDDGSDLDFIEPLLHYHDQIFARVNRSRKKLPGYRTLSHLSTI